MAGTCAHWDAYARKVYRSVLQRMVLGAIRCVSSSVQACTWLFHWYQSVGVSRVYALPWLTQVL